MRIACTYILHSILMTIGSDTAIMPFKIIAIPYSEEEETFLEEELNNFCLNKKIRSYKTEFFVNNGHRPCWTVFIEYDNVLKQIKPEQALSESEKLLFKRLSEWRKERAAKDKIPGYIIATNAQLTELVKKTPKTIDALKSLRGFGSKKIERYGKEIIELIKNFYAPESKNKQ
jgi:superfamily II DNA helicase RecQ